MPKKKTPPHDPEESREIAALIHVMRDVHRLQGELLMIAQSVTDSLTRLTAAVVANTTKIDALIAAGAADPNAATPAEQETIAAAINDQAAAIEANNAK